MLFHCRTTQPRQLSRCRSVGWKGAILVIGGKHVISPASNASIAFTSLLLPRMYDVIQVFTPRPLGYRSTGRCRKCCPIRGETRLGPNRRANLGKQSATRVKQRIRYSEDLLRAGYVSYFMKEPMTRIIMARSIVPAENNTGTIVRASWVSVRCWTQPNCCMRWRRKSCSM